MPSAILPDRGVVELAGADRVAFLQGLVSNDVAAVAPGHAIWAALLTPQGKWLADCFIMAAGDRLLLDCEAGQAAMLVQRLGRYRLRSQVTLGDASAEWTVVAGWDGAAMPEAGPGGAPGEAVVAPDPRLPAAGWRALVPAAAVPATDADAAAWDRHRLALGLPDGSRDLEAEKTVLLEAGFDELGGISWSKGCYMGQELTARTRYRGLLKRRLVPVRIDGPVPAHGTPVLRDGAEVGEMRSGRDGLGLALLRLEALAAPRLDCGEATLHPCRPDWMRLPGDTAA